MKNKLTHKLVGQIVLIGFLIMAAIIIFTTNIIQQYERAQMVEIGDLMANAVKASATDSFGVLVDQTQNLKEDVEKLIESDALEYTGLNMALRNHLNYNLNVDGAFAVIDTQQYTYHPYWYKNQDNHYQSFIEDYKNEIYWKPVEEGRIELLDPTPYQQGDQTKMLSTLLVPIDSEKGYQGLVGVNFSVDIFESLVQEMVISGTFESYLISSNGFIVGNTKDHKAGMYYADAGIEKEWLGREFADKGLVEWQGTYIMTIPIKIKSIDQEWFFVVKVSKEVLYGNKGAIMVIVALPLLLGISVLALYVLFTVRANLRPIGNILEVMNHAGQGQFDRRTNVSSSDEIQVIADGLNALLDSLETHHDQLQKKIDDNALLNAELEALIQENDRIYFEAIKSLNMAIEAKDHYTAGHCDRVTEYALAIGNKIGLSDKEKVRLIYGATIHDIGKIGIPGTIINKPGKLTQAEFDQIKSHPEKGINILEGIHFLEEAIPIVYQHHERYDGKGYPSGYKGDQIDLCARIVAIADTYDAMTSDRAYRKALSKEVAIEEIRRNSGTQFDPLLVEAFLSVFDQSNDQILVQSNEDSKTS